MSSLVQFSAEAAATPPRFALAVNGLRSGQALTWLCADDPVVRSALVELVIDAIADLDTRFVRAGNPLRAPLTMERLLIQAIGPEADLRQSRDPTAVTRQLARRLGDESRLIVILEQAETLDGELLDLLHAMAPYLENAQPRVQFLLSAPHLPPLQTQAEPVPLVYTPLLLPEPSAAPRRLLPFLLAGLMVVLLGIGLGVYLIDPGVIARAKLYVPERFRLGAAAQQPQPPAAPVPRAQEAAPMVPQAPPIAPVKLPAISPPVDNAAAMRREFDDFLTRSGDSVAKLNDTQKAELFDEFLAWRRSQTPTH